MSDGAKMLRSVDVRVEAGGQVLIEHLDCSFEAGQCWVVIGRNGAGKSTLLRTLAGLRPPAFGHIELDGRSLADWPLTALARQRAFLAQGRHDAFAYRVIDTVLSARHPFQDASGYWESEADLQTAHAALQALDVMHLAQRDIRTLSGGERQRVAIAATLAQETPLLLLDEPATALDLGHQWSVMRLLGGLCRAQQKTVIMVSHDLNLAQGIASHALLLMGDGSWQAGPATEMLQASLLSQCLGHPIECVQHAGRIFFLARQDC